MTKPTKESQTIGPSTTRFASTPHPIWWVIALCLVVLALRSFRSEPADMASKLFAQTASTAGAGGVFAFTGQLDKGTHGVFMVDVDAGTLWVYEYKSNRGVGCLELVAARNWRYDRYLEEYNVCGVSPEEVRNLVDEQRRLRLQSLERDLPDDAARDTTGM